MKKQSKEETSKLPPSVWSDVKDLMRPRRGLLLLGFVLIVISRLAGFVLPASTKPLFDEVIGKGRMDLLTPIVLAVLGATLVQGVTAFALTQLLSKEAQRMITDLRRTVQEHIGRLPVAYYDSNKTGALVSRVMSDVEGIRNLVGTGLVDLLGGLLTGVGALAVLIYVSPSLTALTIGIVAVFAFILQKAFKTLRPIFRERGRIRADVTGRLQESLGGVRVVKGYHAEAREASVFSAGVERLLQNVLSTLTGTALVGLAASVLLGVAGALVMYYGARQIASGVLLPGDLVMFTLFLGLLVAPLHQVVNIGTQITEAVAGLERTREVLRESPEDQDPRRAVELGEIRGAVRFDKVSFAYVAGKPVLNDVSFEARPGTVTALVGPSGSGKSTIIGLVAAFYVPTEGTVWVDEADLSTVKLSSYRTQLGVVMQDTFLFAGSIRENVAFARPGASDEEILEACRIARVDEFAEAFEHKYETIVGERGVRLSGGQRQRVSIARAILADPRILILDEATSSLDSESEELIQEGLSYLMKGRTTFVIAHRLSTIRRADQILVIEQGRVHERGTHESLYALGGRYFYLYTKQHGVESNLFLAPGEGAVGDDGSPIGSGVQDNGAGSESGGERDADSPLRVLRGE